MAGLEAIMSWTFMSECPVPADVQTILVEGEQPVVAYKTLRDVAVVTNKRIIVADRQGLTGKKVEIYTIPFKSIVMYSSENAGAIDFNAELELWTRVGKFKLRLGRGVDVRKLDRIIGQYIL